MRFEFESPILLVLLVLVPLLPVVLRFTLLDSPKAQFALSTTVRAVIVILLVLQSSSGLSSIWRKVQNARHALLE